MMNDNQSILTNTRIIDAQGIPECRFYTLLTVFSIRILKKKNRFSSLFEQMRFLARDNLVLNDESSQHPGRRNFFDAGVIAGPPPYAKCLSGSE